MLMTPRWTFGLILGFWFASVCVEAGNALSRSSWRHPEPQGLTLRGVAYGNGRFVAVGEGGTILTSSNGQQWALASTGQFPALRGVTAGSLFMAVGEAGTIVTSSNGFNWISQASGTSVGLLAVAYTPSFLGGTPFLAVGGNGVNLTSVNGLNWSLG